MKRKTTSVIDRLFLDVDGVLADFLTPAVSFHGKTFDPQTYTPALWNTWEFIGCTEDEFWKFDGYEFWRGLQVYEGAKEFVKELEMMFGKNICLLTSPSRHHDCVRGKKDWINEHFPQFNNRVLFGSAKQFCASSRSLLIDDSDANCEAFEEHGGKAVRLQRAWNKLGHHPNAYWNAIYVAVNIRRHSQMSLSA